MKKQMETQGGNLVHRPTLRKHKKTEKMAQDGCSPMPHTGLRGRMGDCHLLAFMHRVITWPDMRYTATHDRPYLSLVVQSAWPKQQ